MATRPHGLTLEINRILPAPPSRVFKAFTDANELARWWGPAGFSIPRLEFDPLVGQSYRIMMQPPEDDAFYLTGEFRVIDPPIRLAYTFRWEEPDPDDVENLVDLVFKVLGQSTAVFLTQGPFKTKARHALHHNGWTDSFDKLEALMASRP